MVHIFNQQSGVNAINMYANRLLLNMKQQTDGEFPISPLTGTFILGIVNAVSGLLAIIPISYIGRKPVLVTGYGLMSIALGLAGLGLVIKRYETSFIAICVYLMLFQLSAGAVTWHYAAEISVDSASGLALAINSVCLI